MSRSAFQNRQILLFVFILSTASQSFAQSIRFQRPMRLKLSKQVSKIKMQVFTMLKHFQMMDLLPLAF